MFDDRILPSIQEAYGNMRRGIWFMQDGAPAHRGLNVRHILHEVFGNRVLGLGFRQEWPPRSPDLTPCDCFLWDRIKNQIYSSPPVRVHRESRFARAGNRHEPASEIEVHLEVYCSLTKQAHAGTYR